MQHEIYHAVLPSGVAYPLPPNFAPTNGLNPLSSSPVLERAFGYTNTYAGDDGLTDVGVFTLEGFWQLDDETQLSRSLTQLNYYVRNARWLTRSMRSTLELHPGRGWARPTVQGKSSRTAQLALTFAPITGRWTTTDLQEVVF